MIKDTFEEYGCEIKEVRSGNVVAYLITSSVPLIEDTLIWNQHQNLETTLASSVYKLLAILGNGVKLDRTLGYTHQSLLDFIDTHYIRLTPSAKLDSVLDYINEQCEYDGEFIDLNGPATIEVIVKYFTNHDEWGYYLRSAISQGLVGYHEKEFPDNQYEKEYVYNLTVAGLTRIIKISEGKHSKQCFIAMAFMDDMFEVLSNGIKPALNTSGYLGFTVNEEQVPSDVTINDAILAGIKKSKFTIADFTHHRAGVYFEAGYALGRGQKVIYTCRQDHMSIAHFDIRNYQHIVWTDATDFKRQLIYKIEAFIKD